MAMKLTAKILAFREMVQNILPKSKENWKFGKVDF